MAIKKGAFDLYTQERVLPSKKTNSSVKKSHFFDDINENGSQMVHDSTSGIDVDPKGEAATNHNISSLDQRHELEINGSQLDHNRFNETEVIDVTNSPQSQILEDKRELQHNEKVLTTTISKVVGNQREIVLALYKNMRLNKSDSTEELTLDTISNLSGVNIKSLKNTLFRLTSAGVISRTDQKVGRGGWVKYQIHPDIINQLQDYFLFAKSKK